MVCLCPKAVTVVSWCVWMIPLCSLFGFHPAIDDEFDSWMLAVHNTDFRNGNPMRCTVYFGHRESNMRVEVTTECEATLRTCLSTPASGSPPWCIATLRGGLIRSSGCKSISFFLV